MTEKKESWMEGGVEVASQAVTWGKPGNFLKGTYCGKKMIKANDREVALYELKGIVGSFNTVDSKKNPVEPPVSVVAGSYYNIFGGKDAIDSLFAKSKLGDIVAVQLKEEVPSKVKGHADFKVFKTIQFGPDKSYMGETAEAVGQVFEGSEEVTGDDLPFK